MTRHMQRMGCVRGNPGVSACSRQRFIRKRRIVEAVNQVMCNTGMIGIPWEYGQEDLCGLFLLSQRLVVVVCKASHLQRIEDCRFVVVGIALMKRLHSFKIRGSSRSMGHRLPV